MSPYPLRQIPPCIITDWQLRRLFNEGHYKRIIRSDRFRPVTLEFSQLKDNSPRICKATPRGSVKQTLGFRDKDDNTVFVIVRYITPQGKVGASGKNDPTMIVLNGVVYRRAVTASDFQVVKRLSTHDINELLNKRGIYRLLTYFHSARAATGPHRHRIKDWWRKTFGLERYHK